MNEAIMRWPSEKLYDNKLVAADSIKGHLLKDLNDVESNENTNVPLVFVDTAGCDMYEMESDSDFSSSKGNEYEVDIIRDHVKELVDSGVKPLDIGIITPYNQQVELLRQALRDAYPLIEINSVDGFQGREKEAILISMVRSNEKGEVGFLSEDRRINVAITRARRHLFVVADSSTISKHCFLNSLCCFLNKNAFVKLAKSCNSVPPSSVLNSNHTSSLELPESFKNINFKNNHKKLYTQTIPCDREVENDKKVFVDKSVAVRDSSGGNHVLLTVDTSTNTIKDSESDIENFEEIILRFVNSDEKMVFDFPVTLSAKERALIHSISENYDINHTSMGEGNKRKVVLTKKNDSTEMSEDKTGTTEKKVTTDKIGVVKCEKCCINVPSKNYELHLLRCSGANKTETVSQSSCATKKKKKKSSKKPGIDDSIADDFDSLVQSFITENSLCRFESCKKSIQTLGQKCQFCSQMFCLSHHMAEIHGCGKAIHLKARQDIAKYGVNVPREMNKIKKVQVQNKLGKKLNELENDRKKKSKK